MAMTPEQAFGAAKAYANTLAMGDNTAIPGPTGPKGDKGDTGATGESAYQTAVDNGFVGDEAAWLTSLKGADGKDGKDGADGAPGSPGADGQPGADGAPGAAGKDGKDGVDGLPGTDGANGAAGADGTIITISDSGTIVRDGVDTGVVVQASQPVIVEFTTTGEQTVVSLADIPGFIFWVKVDEGSGLFDVTGNSIIYVPGEKQITVESSGAGFPGEILYLKGSNGLFAGYATQADLTALKAYTDTAFTKYLTEDETYAAIAERIGGLLSDKGPVPTRADLPTTANNFDSYVILNEGEPVLDGDNNPVLDGEGNPTYKGLRVYAENTNGVLVWHTLNFTVNLSDYETTAGASEKMAAAVETANASTDNKLTGYALNTMRNYLPAGDGTVEYWNAIPNGDYIYYDGSGVVADMPTAVGLVTIGQPQPNSTTRSMIFLGENNSGVWVQSIISNNRSGWAKLAKANDNAPGLTVDKQDYQDLFLLAQAQQAPSTRVYGGDRLINAPTDGSFVYIVTTENTDVNSQYITITAHSVGYRNTPNLVYTVTCTSGVWGNWEQNITATAITTWTPLTFTPTTGNSASGLSFAYNAATKQLRARFDGATVKDYISIGDVIGNISGMSFPNTYRLGIVLNNSFGRVPAEIAIQNAGSVLLTPILPDMYEGITSLTNCRLYGDVLIQID